MGEGLSTQTISNSNSNSSSKTMMIVLAIGIVMLCEIGYSHPSSLELMIRLIAGLILVSVSVCLPLEVRPEMSSCVRMSLVERGVWVG